MSNNCAIILAGGNGKRMKANMPKPMFKVLGEPMLEWAIRACENSDLENICVVTGYEHQYIEEYLNRRYPTVLQTERRGTGHAVMQAKEYLEKFRGGNTLILCGDAPFIDEETIMGALSLHEESNNAVTVITACVENPFGYGRIIRRNNGISAIVEEKDVTDEQRKINEINSGAYWFSTDALLEALELLTPNNAQNEYYLTDTIVILLNRGYSAGAYTSANPNAVLGANDRKGLLLLNTVARMNVIDKHMNNGVEFNCTDGITIERDVEIGVGTVILPGTMLCGKTKIGEHCVIGPNTIIENCTVGNGTKLNYVQAYESEIGSNVSVGPFVHIRPNTVLKDGIKIGDFVEVKNSTIGESTAIAHLSYVGDSDVGSGVNFGCGTATANYNGVKKSRTVIGDNAFIGCHTSLIAPVTVGNNAYTAAGTTVTKNLPDNSFAIDRGKLSIREDFADKLIPKK